jgi:hypothetical protein
MTNIPFVERIAAALVGGKPLAYQAYEDGSLVVIADSGKKFRFSADQVINAGNALKPKPIKRSASAPAKPKSVQSNPSGKPAR